MLMRRNALCFSFAVVCCLFLALTAAVCAAGSYAAGWTVAGAEIIPAHFDPGNGNVTTNAQYRAGIGVADGDRAVRSGCSAAMNRYNTPAVRVSGTGSSLGLNRC